MLASAGLSKNDVDAQAAVRRACGSSSPRQGRRDAAVPDWIVSATQAGRR